MYIKWQERVRRDQALRKRLRRIPCPSSKTYDRAHMLENGLACKYKHCYYHWHGVTDDRVVLVGDSIFKWVKDVAHLEIKAYPGLDLLNAFVKMCSGEASLVGHAGLVLAAGGNNIQGNDVFTILKKFRACFTML